MSIWTSSRTNSCQISAAESSTDPKHHHPLLVAVEVPNQTVACGLFCGDCSLALESSNAFFSHWLALHCQPHSPDASNAGGDGCSRDNSKLVMQRCLKCNHIFVEGTDRCTQHTLNGCQSGTNTQLQSFVYSNSVDVNPNRKRKQEDDCSPTPANKVSSVGKSGLANPFGGSKRCVCGLCHAQVKSVTSYFLHWVREHREATTETVLQEVWQCKACPANITRLFPDTQALRGHVASEHASRDSNEQQNHIFALGAPTQCPLVFTGEDECNRHFMACHATTPTAGQVCSVCQQEVVDQCKHFIAMHDIRCQLCGASVDSQSDLKHHWENRHKCDLVWSRSSKLQLTDKVLGSTRQSPARLANGAIAKTANLIGSLVAAPPQSLLSQPPEPLLGCEPRVLQNAALREKFLPIEGKSEFKCVKCNQQFVNEKLMERHYFANHEFRCKFCELVMDKDNYGVHLRQHLATERRKNNQCF